MATQDRLVLGRIITEGQRPLRAGSAYISWLVFMVGRTVWCLDPVCSYAWLITLWIAGPLCCPAMRIISFIFICRLFVVGLLLVVHKHTWFATVSMETSEVSTVAH